MKGLKFLFCGVALVWALAAGAQQESGNVINRVVSEDNVLYVAMSPGGVVTINLDTEEITRYTKETAGLPKNYAYDVAVHDGVIYFALTNEGVLQIKDGVASRIEPIYDGIQITKTVRALSIDREGRLWFCSELYIYCWDGEELKTYTSSSWHGLSHMVFEAFGFDSQGRTWFGSSSGGFGYYQQGDEEAKRLFRWPTVEWVNVDANDNVWAAVMCDLPDAENVTGIGKYLGEKNFEVVARTDKFAGCIKFDAEGNVWYLDGSKIMCYDGKEARTVVEMTEAVPTCFEPVGGIVWIGTKDGLYRYSGAPVEKVNLGGTNGIVEAVADVPAEYFDLMGRRVAEPAAGIYICRRGASTSKVLVR